jgi:hypothetical protein
MKMDVVLQASFCVELPLSESGVAGSGAFVVPQWQFAPQLHGEDPDPASSVSVQQLAFATGAPSRGLALCRLWPAFPQRHSFAPVQQQEPADFCCR